MLLQISLKVWNNDLSMLKQTHGREIKLVKAPQMNQMSQKPSRKLVWLGIKRILLQTIEVGLMLLAGMNWNSHALGTKNWQGLAPNLVERRIEVES